MKILALKKILLLLICLTTLNSCAFYFAKNKYQNTVIERTTNDPKAVDVMVLEARISDFMPHKRLKRFDYSLLFSRFFKVPFGIINNNYHDFSLWDVHLLARYYPVIKRDYRFYIGAGSGRYKLTESWYDYSGYYCTSNGTCEHKFRKMASETWLEGTYSIGIAGVRFGRQGLTSMWPKVIIEYRKEFTKGRRNFNIASDMILVGFMWTINI